MSVRGWSAVGLVVFGVWALFVGVWAVRPQEDHVPTGVIDGEHTFQVVACNSPVAGDPGPNGPLPELADGRAYQRVACAEMHGEQRRVLVFDVVAVAVLVAGLVVARRRWTRSVDDPSSA